jgi:hypothetical protein
MPRRRRRNATVRRPASTLTQGDRLTSGDSFTPSPANTPQAAPARPAMPAPTYDSTYWNDMASNQAGYDTFLAGIGLSAGRLGFDSGFDAQGQVDLSNPYSQAMLLQRHKEQATTGINNSMASAGQQYSGARLNAQDENSYQYERNRSNLQTQTQRGYQDLDLERRSATDSYNSGKYGAAAGQAERWRDQERDWYDQHA